MSLLSPKHFSFLIVVAGSLASGQAGAAEYNATAIVDSETFYDSNLALRPDNCGAQPPNVCEIEELEAYALAPRLNLRARGAGWQADVKTLLRFTRFSEQRYDSDDQILDLSLRRFSEKQAFDLDGEIRRESTRSEVEEVGSAATRRVRSSLRPSWTRVFNQKNSLVVGGSWLDTKYDALSLSDYEQYGFDATWIRQLDERLSLQVGLYSSRFESGDAPEAFFPDLPFTSSDTLGLTTALTRQFNEQWSGTLNIGTRSVDTKTRVCAQSFFGFCLQGGTIEGDSIGFTSSSSVEYSGETWTGSAEASRSLNPSGVLGDLVESDRLSLAYARQLGPRLYFDLTVDFISDTSLDDRSPYERESWIATPSVRWQFSERWSLTTLLRHRTRDRLSGLVTQESDGTAIIFKVRYAHPRASWSR